MDCCAQLILNEAEVKIKTAMWMRQNADFLKEMKGAALFITIFKFNVLYLLSSSRHIPGVWFYVPLFLVKYDDFMLLMKSSGWLSSRVVSVPDAVG